MMPFPVPLVSQAAVGCFLYGVFLLQGGVRWVGSHADLELYISSIQAPIQEMLPYIVSLVPQKYLFWIPRSKLVLFLIK